MQGIYSITKAAVISMTKAFAVECAEGGVRCNALLPGLTDTKFASVLVNTPAILKQAMAHVPMKRVAQPSEMAGAVLYLASAASSYTTGAAIECGRWLPVGLTYWPSIRLFGSFTMTDVSAHRVAGKKAFITGAAGGLGAAMAQLLARHGALVFLTDIDEAAVYAVATPSMPRTRQDGGMVGRAERA